MPETPPTPGKLPDLILIGAMKSATSSLHHWLGSHPSVAVSNPKELDFFVEPRYSRLGVDWYRTQFTDPAGAEVAVESSPNYTKAHQLPGVPGRMAALLPDVKLVYVVRDPIDRVLSHYVHDIAAASTRDSFHDWVKDPERSIGVQTSRYHWQLSLYLEQYPADRIRVIDMNRIRREPVAVTTELLEWVGLDPAFDEAVVGRRVHDSRNKIAPNALGRLFWSNKKMRRKLRSRVPWLVGRPIVTPEWLPEDRQRVADYLADDVAALRRLTGQGFDDWNL